MPKAKLKSKTTSNRPAHRRLRVQRIVSLPPEWDCFIPPAMVNVEAVHAGSMVGSQPKWNPQWLAGLEKYVRAIVQDELRQANTMLYNHVAAPVERRVASPLDHLSPPCSPPPLPS